MQYYSQPPTPAPANYYVTPTPHVSAPGPGQEYYGQATASPDYAAAQYAPSPVEYDPTAAYAYEYVTDPPSSSSSSSTRDGFWQKKGRAVAVGLGVLTLAYGASRLLAASSEKKKTVKTKSKGSDANDTAPRRYGGYHGDGERNVRRKIELPISRLQKQMDGVNERSLSGHDCMRRRQYKRAAACFHEAIVRTRTVRQLVADDREFARLFEIEADELLTLLRDDFRRAKRAIESNRK